MLNKLISNNHSPVIVSDEYYYNRIKISDSIIKLRYKKKRKLMDADVVVGYIHRVLGVSQDADSRKSNRPKVRAVCCYVLHKYYRLNLSEIGLKLGVKKNGKPFNHSTVIHHLKFTESLKRIHDPMLYDMLHRVKKDFEI